MEIHDIRHVGMCKWSIWIQTIDMLNKCSQVLVDEAFMTNNKYMRLLKILKVPVTYLGDPNQLHPIYNKEQPCNDQWSA